MTKMNEANDKGEETQSQHCCPRDGGPAGADLYVEAAVDGGVEGGCVLHPVAAWNWKYWLNA
jgi:hypothetical protein